MAAGRFATLAALFTGAAAPVAVPAAGTDPLANLEMDDATRAALGTELQAFAAEQMATGFKAGNDRAVKVMGSDKGKAHPATALAFLGNEKLSALSAEDIIASLPDAPVPGAKTGTEDGGAAAAAAAAAAGGGTEAGKGGSQQHQERLAAAPKIALGANASTDATVEETDSKGADKPKAVAMWGKAQGITEGGKTGANGAVVGAAR
jgi:hypothetical protein